MLILTFARHIGATKSSRNEYEMPQIVDIGNLCLHAINGALKYGIEQDVKIIFQLLVLVN